MKISQSGRQKFAYYNVQYAQLFFELEKHLIHLATWAFFATNVSILLSKKL